ncbi:MAG: RHS repeat-associated core domain-containing protein, partial [Alphaproteobacteria bacterium]|nr:RHS repeat-associated core domain-containing protein [Alphaproteobacteria bacterium]
MVRQFSKKLGSCLDITIFCSALREEASFGGVAPGSDLPASFRFSVRSPAAVNDNRHSPWLRGTGRGSGANYTYAYDAVGDMAQADRDGLTLARYTADARHLRVVRDLPGASVPKTHFVYDADGPLLAEHDGTSGAVLREVIWLPPQEQTQAAFPLGWVEAAAAGAPLYMVHADHLNRPQKLSDATGAVVWDGVFGPFGEPHAITGGLAQNLRFPGQYADSETGLAYNWHRTSDPATGRYLQSDPIGLAGGIQTYAYVNGNPLRYSDPDGLNPAAGATLGGMAAGPPGAVVGGAIGLGLSIGALAILNEILDGADDPA